jgi:hypothetical protein
MGFMMVMERYEVTWKDKNGDHSLVVFGSEKLTDLLSIVAGTGNDFNEIHVKHTSALGDAYVQTVLDQGVEE